MSRDSDDAIPASREPPASARLVLTAGILAGITGAVVTPLLDPKQLTLASEVYLAAGDAVLTGGNVYEVSPPGLSGYHYIYPPVVVLVFVPHALVGTSLAAFAIQTLGNVAAAGGIAVVLRRALERRGVAITTLDRALLAGFAFCSAYSAITVVNGQVTLWLAFAVAAGIDALEADRDRFAGVAFAAAALVKVFPAALGLWLVRRRAPRGVAAAILTGTGGLALGVVLLGPELTATYFTEVLTGRYDGFHGAPEPTETRGGVQRQLAALFGLGGRVLTPLAFLVLAPIVLVLYRRVDTDERRQAAILGTIVATLLFFPLQRLYMSLLFFPLVVLLYLTPRGRARTVLLVGTLLSFLRLDYGLLETTITGLGLPAALESATLTVTDGFFRTILPPTLGMWLLLAGCVLVHVESVPSSDREPVG